MNCNIVRRVALTAFVGDWGREVGEDRMFFFDPGDEATAYAKSIAPTVALLEAQDLADPVFLAIERHHGLGSLRLPLPLRR
jgi:hypothetical protein